MIQLKLGVRSVIFLDRGESDSLSCKEHLKSHSLRSHSTEEKFKEHIE